MATSVAASQARVLAGVLVGCGIAAAPLAFKSVRDTENRVRRPPPTSLGTHGPLPPHLRASWPASARA